MRPWRGSLWCCALAVLALSSRTGYAAWDNVFQVCCNRCQNNSTANYPPVVAVPAAAPLQQQCTTRYEQRSYYQPVVSYTPYTYTESVTTLRTSYYWDPVTSYHTSCYYDPSSCSYRRVSTPTISYSLRAQSCPVTNYVERTALKPVTTQQLVTYYQPVTNCCQTTMGAPVMSLPPGAAVVPAAGEQTGPPPVAPPVGGDRTLPGGSDTSRKIDRIEPIPRTMPRADDNGFYRAPELKAPVTPTSPNPAPSSSPSVRIERIAMLPEHDVVGQVLTTTSQPRAGARVLLVSKDQANIKQAVTADEKGQFQVRLTSGAWLVYVRDAEGTAIYQDVLEVRGEQANPFILTSR